MKIARTLALLAAGSLMSVTTLQAKLRTCRVVFPERPQSAPKFAYLFDGSKNHKVTLPSMNLSEMIELPDGELTIAMVANEIRDPKALSPNAPILKLSEKLKDFYIIITSDPQNNEIPLKMNLVDTGDGKFNSGETLWFNLTENRIVAKLGSADMSVDPGGRTISKAPVTASGYYEARFAYQVKGRGPLAPITEQSWWHDAKSRHLGFIVSSGGKLPKIYFYCDFRDSE